MPIGTCNPASRGEAFNQFSVEIPAPNRSGSVLIVGRYTWDGVSQRNVGAGCDGPVIHLELKNTSNMTAWAMLPDKKRGNKWIQADPGTDVITTNQGLLDNLGVSNALDVITTKWSFTNPAP